MAKKKSFVIVDKVRFRNLVIKGRASGTLPLDHDGRCLEMLEARVCVGSAGRVYSENQALVCAAVSGTLQSFNDLRDKNEPYTADFRDSTRFVAIERRILSFLKRDAKIDWNIQAARVRLHRLMGDGVIDQLCTSYARSLPKPERKPRKRRSDINVPVETLPWFATREPGSDQSERGPYVLYGLFDPLEFPLREIRHEPFAVLAPMRRRRRVHVRPMRQLELRWNDPSRPAQLLLDPVLLPPPATRQHRRRSPRSRAPHAPSAQGSLRHVS